MKNNDSQVMFIKSNKLHRPNDMPLKTNPHILNLGSGEENESKLSMFDVNLAKGSNGSSVNPSAHATNTLVDLSAIKQPLRASPSKK
jgi:hypothetical protein